MGIDLTQDGVIEGILKVSEGATDIEGNRNEAWEAVGWPERIFSIAFRCSTGNKVGDLTDDELIKELCLGNWAIGFVDGLPGDGEQPWTCPSCLIKQHSSAIGKAGAEKRHAPNAALREWAIERYREGVWKSANQAAHALKEAVIEHGRTIGAVLSEENAQRTIAEWIRKSV